MTNHDPIVDDVFATVEDLEFSLTKLHGAAYIDAKDCAFGMLLLEAVSKFLTQRLRPKKTKIQI